MENWIWFILIGAVLGGFLFSLLGLAATNTLGRLIAAFGGAVVLLLAIGFVKRKGA
jgi:uncharacterized membrane protein YeaQ/YmgE (transglycosylase-associated protein family)